MRRRKFIGLLGVAGVGSLVAGYVIAPSFENTLEKIIEENIKGLKLEKGAVKAFLADAGKEGILGQYDLSKREFIRGHYLLENGVINLPYKHKYTQMRDDLVGRFLLSTDFFTHKMDTEKQVSYVGLYDPYDRPCSNPFSSVYYKQ